ncbi:MAG: DUF1566 domain-containing protein, partial [Nitrospirales bacterium]|nr:DUF1566 domain-containing protein [Nitrospirales bacterium]
MSNNLLFYFSISLLFIFHVSLSSAATIELPRTGQTKCYDSNGQVIDCLNTGQDGEFRSGVRLPVSRFINKEDGTIIDLLTGLVWASDTSSPSVGSCSGGSKSWQDALAYVSCLNSINYLGYNTWRLPNRNELESLVERGRSNLIWWLNSNGFQNIKIDNYYWSSTTWAKDTVLPQTEMDFR